jgi:CHAT domain-containing protein
MCARRPGRAAGPPLICGIPAPDTPGIGREVAALGELFPDAATLVGDAATRAAFAAAAAGRRIVHVAAHARFRADNPMLSSLAFADGELTFYDVFGLRLGADLVTLSGCDTGAIAVETGDELHGLMRGFLYAGAPSLLLSLWPADDAATAEFMGEFYARVRAGETKREALRSAQREVMRRHAHPYYWAPFSLIGRAI